MKRLRQYIEVILMMESYKKVFKAFGDNKSESLLKDTGIEVKDEEGSIRSFKDIFKDISKHMKG